MAVETTTKMSPDLSAGDIGQILVVFQKDLPKYGPTLRYGGRGWRDVQQNVRDAVSQLQDKSTEASELVRLEPSNTRSIARANKMVLESHLDDVDPDRRQRRAAARHGAVLLARAALVAASHSTGEGFLAHGAPFHKSAREVARGAHG